MAGSVHYVQALINSHGLGDDANFYSVALQLAAKEARAGHHIVAEEIRKAVAESRERPPQNKVTALVKPRGDLEDLVELRMPEVKLRNLVVSSHLEEKICNLIAEQRQRKVLEDHGFYPVHRILLEGPPGTGKTMTAAVIAGELSLPLLTVRLDRLMSKYMGETASKLRLVFDSVAQHRAVYLFDEFDALGADRGSSDVGEVRRVLNSFLIFLEESSPQSLILAATNHRKILDRALFRRFDDSFVYGLPDKDQAQRVMRDRLRSFVDDSILDDVAEYLQGLSHAEIVKAAESAAKMALLNKRSTVSRTDLVKALESRKATSFG